MAADEMVGAVVIEEVRRKDTEPLCLGVTIVDTEGTYVTHTFKQPKDYADTVVLMIPSKMFDKENELRQQRNRLVELEREVKRLRTYEQAIDQVKGYYPTAVFLPDSTTKDAESARWARMVCDNIRSAAEQLQEELT